MDGKKIPVWSWRQAIAKADVPPLTKLVCYTIANHINDLGAGAFPTVESLMADTGLSNRSVATHLANAKEGGLLAIKRSRADQGTWKHYHYYPRFPKNVDLPRVDDECSDVSQPREDYSRGPREDYSPDYVKEVHANSPSEVSPSEVNPPPPKKGVTPTDALTAFEAYNATALRCGLAQASKLTPDRQRKIVAKLKVYGLDGWHKALANIEHSAFLRGETEHGFRTTLDFVLQNISFNKLHDGGFGNGAGHGRPSVRPASQSVLDKMRAQAAANGGKQ